MRRILLSSLTVLALAGATSAVAQTTGVAVEIAPEQRTIMKQYVVREKIAPVTVQERVTVGSTLPADVELRAVPSDWGPSVSQYRYIYYDDNVVLVEPSTRRVVRIID